MPPSAEINRAMAKAALLHDQEPSILASLKDATQQTANTRPTTTFHIDNGTSHGVHLHSHCRETHRDEYL